LEMNEQKESDHKSLHGFTMVVVNSKSPGCNPRGGNSEQIQIHASLVEHGTSGIMNQRQNVGFPIFLCESPARGKATCCKAQPADFCVSF